MCENGNFNHLPVLLKESIEGLNIKPNGIYVDGTLGGAGHAIEIAKQLNPDGLLIGIDRDEAAITTATSRLKKINSPFITVRDNHDNLQQILHDLSVRLVDGFLLDLGVSSHQLDTPERGFSYRYDAPLDMRMDNRSVLTAYDIVNNYSEKDLQHIIKNYGEERYAKRISRAIKQAINKNRPVDTTLQLAQIITDAVPKGPPSAGHPAMRTFQAVRIVVNAELSNLARTIEHMSEFLKPGGRICIITFHSLEDRIVKQTFKNLADPCKCPRELPYCICGKVPELSIITKKPIRPGADETNPRAHSAKLRIAQKL